MNEPLFIGRKKEREKLQQLLDKKSASLVVVKGRRRIGKSRLLEEFCKKIKFIKLIGLPPTTSTQAQSQRDEFSRQLSEQSDIPNIQAKDWGDLFSLLAKETSTGRIIIVLDEISWMGSKDEDFLGKLKTAWDEKFKKNPKLILILCSSVSFWIEENILSSTGFMGRISLTLSIEELSLSESNQLLVAQGSRLTPYEKFKILSVTGGIPRYLEEVQSKLSADENIKQLCFSASGVLFKEFNHIFSDLFTVRSSYYKKIVEALVDGDLEYEDLCQKLGVERSGFWKSYLDELIKSGFIKRDFTWIVKTEKESRLSRYRLSDNYLRFYLKYIDPVYNQIDRGAFENKALSVLPGWDSVMGLQFENLVLNNRPFIWEKLKLDSNEVLIDNPYFQRKTQRHQGCQIDYLIKSRTNTFFACEIKFSRDEIKPDVIESMKKKLVAFLLPKGCACIPVLIHVNGVRDSVIESNYFGQIINFCDLLEP